MSTRSALPVPSRFALRAAALATALALAAVGATAPTTALAHHAFAAEFDADKPIDLKGTVTKVKWVNPHSWLYFDVKGADGAVTNWGVEFRHAKRTRARGPHQG